ncbi:GDP-L-fucose synthase [Novipirellula aureliae]|uniref:GDP-L-fucose synthase n=1 Tax=Novipirellula aureliae TaxID=2527966 RepID=A0A5C6DLS2_9BACT|nr:GDP-L-fucose synthase [Novipirellula aureliae]TWU37738.1 GDP-L-fucose synthase [Novipirellula aureliae]
MTQITGKIYVAGHRGMVGSAVCRRLAKESCQIITATREQLDLTDAAAVSEFFSDHKPDAVVFAAAKVGGVLANDTFPVEFLSDNVLMSTAAINAAYQANVNRFLFLGSTCIYPRDCAQPIQEDSLLSGPLEKTNEAYALAKICGLKLCQFYRRQHGVLFHSAMPTNLYGPGDNYHREHSHVLPALIRRFHEAKQNDDPEVMIWGTGTPRREFLHVDDLADAITFLLGTSEPPDWVNVGTGVDLSISELAKLVAQTVGYSGAIVTDPARPDGTPVKCTDMTKLHTMGWKHSIDLANGLEMTYHHYLEELESGKLRSV